MVLSVLLDSLLHETGKRRENVDRRINLLVVELPVDEYLPFCDIASQIRDGVSNIVVLLKKIVTGMDRIGI